MSAIETTLGKLNPVQMQVATSNEGAITWGHLNQRHSEYDADKVKKRKLLLEGGDDIIKHATMFIKKKAAESDAAYRDRLSFAAYENHFGEIINDLSASLHAKPIAIVPATDADDGDTPGEEPDPNSPYMLWQQKFTLDGRKMSDFFQMLQAESNAIGKAYYGVDFDDDGNPYAYHIDSCSVLDWELDDAGEYTLLVLRDDSSIRKSIMDRREFMTTTFSVWTRDNDIVALKQYRIKYPIGKEPDFDEPVASIGKSSDFSFKLIPVICYETPRSICVGDLIAMPAASIFERETSYKFCVNRAQNPILVYKQGAEFTENGDLSSIGQKTSRGNIATSNSSAGKAVIGPNDDMKWIGVESSIFTVVQDQLEKDKNELYRLTSNLTSIIGHQGVSTAQTRSSGEAKRLDNLAKQNLLTSYAKNEKIAIIKGFKIVFDAFDQDIEWQAKGMDNYKVVAEDELIAKIQSLPVYKTNMPSKTSYRQILLDTAYEVHPFTNVGTMDKIIDEISTFVDKMPEPDPNSEASPSEMRGDAAVQASKSSPSEMRSEPSALLGKSGNAMTEPDSHLQTGQHISWQVPYKDLEKDYPKKNLEWMKVSSWRGPLEVDPSQIDFHGEENWKANQPGPNGLEKVDKYAEIMNDKGFEAFNPVILANTPHDNEKYTPIDGRHRIKASQKAGVPILAYIADVGSTDDDTPHMQMHDAQSGSGS